MRRRFSVQISYNFDRNLDQIREFLNEQGEVQAFDGLLDRLFETIIPNLERFPELGTDFFARAPQSLEGQTHLEGLKKRLGRDVWLREYITGDYMLLYAVRGTNIYLLSIKHHRQLSFDLKSNWML